MKWAKSAQNTDWSSSSFAIWQHSCLTASSMRHNARTGFKFKSAGPAYPRQAHGTCLHAVAVPPSGRLCVQEVHYCYNIIMTCSRCSRKSKQRSYWQQLRFVRLTSGAPIGGWQDCYRLGAGCISALWHLRLDVRISISVDFQSTFRGLTATCGTMHTRQVTRPRGEHQVASGWRQVLATDFSTLGLCN